MWYRVCGCDVVLHAIKFQYAIILPIGLTVAMCREGRNSRTKNTDRQPPTVHQGRPKAISGCMGSQRSNCRLRACNRLTDDTLLNV